MKIKWLSKNTEENASYISKPELSLCSHNVSTVMVLKYRVFFSPSLKTPASLLYVKCQRSFSKKELPNTFKQKFWEGQFVRFVHETVCSLAIKRFVRMHNCS